MAEDTKSKKTNSQFNYVGEFAQRIAKYHLRKVKEAVKDGIPALNADLGWKTFLAEEPTLVQEIATKHPPPAKQSNDTTLRVRNNQSKGADRIIRWLKGEDHGELFLLFWSACHSNF